MGLGLATLAFVMLSLVDVLIKLLSESISVYQLTTVRGAIACAVMLAILGFRGELGAIRTRKPRLQILAGLLTTVAALSFFFALSMMPIVDLYVIAFTAPFFVAVLSWPLLREPVSRSTWIAISIGFVGVLITFQPSGVTLGWASLLGFTATIAYACSNLVFRSLGPEENPLVTTFYLMAISGGISLLIGFHTWTVPEGMDFVWLIALGLLAAFGRLALSSAFRFAPAAVIAPTDYTSLLWGILYGYLIFGDVPGQATLLGGVVISAGGLWLLRNQYLTIKPKEIPHP